MSVLETPRILFKGEISWDPIVTNNRSSFYNEDKAESVLTPAETAQQFRESAIAAVGSGIWNPQGTHRSVFYDTCISGVDLGAGVVGDPFVASPASFAGMLVDAEPYGGLTSQLFFDSMTFGIDGGCRILAPRSSRFTARQINFSRNINYQVIAGVASVVWQTSFAKADGLSIDAFDSPALRALEAHLREPGVLGLTVRFNAYRTIYYDSLEGDSPQLAQELTAKLNEGGFQPNPARSVLVGVIGLWREGEPAHEPGDRCLANSEPATGPSIATASARLTERQVTLDLANSICEEDATLVKQDLGPLSVVAVEADGKTVAVNLGTFGYDRYDRHAYEKNSGIVTLDIGAGDAKRAAGLDLQLRGAGGNVYLAEQALRALPMDPNLYVDEGEETGTRIRLLDRGLPAAAGLNISLAKTNAAGMVVPGGVTQVTTGAGGIAPVPVSGGAGDVAGYMLLPGPNPAVPQGIDPQVNTYMYIRTLPADDDTARLPATWGNVYAKVLLNWHAMAPCMDNWLDLGSEAQVKAYAPVLRKLTDPAYFEAFRFMPVTRDMTKGERILLYRFLDGPRPSAMKGMAAPAVQPPAPPSNAKLSRSLRGN